MSHPLVLFDGVCNFCNGMINFAIRQDKNDVLRFAALQSTAGQKLLQQYGLPTGNHESFILLDKGQAYTRSTASLKV
jgi:predicted DCC family thiol-disulfide oxidoreductase YuxK